MIRTVTFRCSLPKAKADALNLESGAVYTRVLVEHYRIYRHTGHWLSVGAASRIEDQLGGPTTLVLAENCHLLKDLLVNPSHPKTLSS